VSPQNDVNNANPRLKFWQLLLRLAAGGRQRGGMNLRRSLGATWPRRRKHMRGLVVTGAGNVPIDRPGIARFGAP
jgi:hypothetical protein